MNEPLQLRSLPDPRAILFDLDGTLVDTVHARIEAWRTALEAAGIPVDSTLLPLYIGSDGRWLASEMARASGHPIDEAVATRLDLAHGEIFDRLNARPQPLPGASELLTALERSHLAFGVATSSQAGQVAVSIEALRLPAPPAVVNGGTVARAKPEPDLLLAGAEALGAPPSACWYVGDSTWDMVASVRAGMTGIGVTTGAVDADALLRAGASAAVPSLSAVLDELRRRALLGDDG